MSWNSSLNMIVGLLHSRNVVTNVLKQTGHCDNCLKVHKWSVLKELRNFLHLFSGMTDLVSTRITSRSLHDT